MSEQKNGPAGMQPAEAKLRSNTSEISIANPQNAQDLNAPPPEEFSKGNGAAKPTVPPAYAAEKARMAKVEEAARKRAHPTEAQIAAERARHARKKVCLEDLIKNTSDLQTKTFDPLRWIVPNYLPEGLTVLGGRPKIGKSWMLLDLAIAVAEGGKFLGEQCEQGDVLALFLEDGDRRIQRRITQMLGANKHRWPSNLTYATDWPRLHEGGLDLIGEWLAKKKRRLLIIDIIEKVRRREKSDKITLYSADYEALAARQKLAETAQLSIVPSHHQRKQLADDIIDTLSGTLGLGGAADAVIVLAQDSLGKYLEGRGRDLEEFKISVQQNDKARWDNLGRKLDAPKTPERASIINALAKAGGPMSLDEIALATGRIKDSIKPLLTRMVDAGEIDRKK